MVLVFYEREIHKPEIMTTLQGKMHESLALDYCACRFAISPNPIVNLRNVYLLILVFS